MPKQPLKGKIALITGASSGLGVDFSHELARRGMNLVLVARREERLLQLEKELCDQYGVRSWVIPMDLGVPGAAQQLYETTHHLGLEVHILINNAGFATHRNFAETSWERDQQMLQLNVTTAVHLTKLYLQEMLQRNSGYILLVSSIGAFLPAPTYAVYSAAKGFLLLFGEAFNYELRDTNVSCTVLAPGFTDTEFLQVAGQTPSLYERLVMMPSTRAAQVGIRAMLARRSSVVPGWINALTVWILRLLPRRAAAFFAYWFINYG
jgi:short-subunit dehydrogenase